MSKNNGKGQRSKHGLSPASAEISNKQSARKARRRAQQSEREAKNRARIAAAGGGKFLSATSRRKFLDECIANEKAIKGNLALMRTGHPADKVELVPVVAGAAYRVEASAVFEPELPPGLTQEFESATGEKRAKVLSRAWLLDVCEEMGIKTTSKSTVAQMKKAIAEKNAMLFGE